MTLPLPLSGIKDPAVRFALERLAAEVLTDRIFHGTGDPESVVTAPIGSLYLRGDGGAATSLYVKESGTGSTGWAGK